jgi:hypothetical protein
MAGVYLPALCLTVFLLYRYAGYEIVLIGALLDGYYAAFVAGVPWYTIGAFSLWTGAVILKEALIVYNTDHAPLS